MKSQFLTGRDIAYIAVFAGLTAALGLVPPIVTPFSPVPITAQSLSPVLAGAVLGAKRGALSQALFAVLVALGLPLLSGGRGGLTIFVSPTAGFVLGWILVALAVGWLSYRNGRYILWQGLIGNLIFGMFVLYGCGIISMMAFGGMQFTAAVVGMTPFLPGDTLKMVIAALVAKGVHQAMPSLMAKPGQWPAEIQPEKEVVSN